MHSFALFMGFWVTTCIQTQVSEKQGYTVESYTIESMGQYQFTRLWYEDPSCQREVDREEEIGQITLGNRLRGVFMPDKTIEANFTTPDGSDRGALAITPEQKLKVSRGVRGADFRNTMLSLFDFSKVPEEEGNY